MNVWNTLRYVKERFAGQVDKSGQAKWCHSVRVMSNLPENATDDELTAALLHDVLEDTNTTEADLLKAGFSERVVELVKLLTKPKGMSYDEYLQRLVAANDRSAIRIKLADNADNSDPLRLVKLDVHTRNRLETKYKRARDLLLAA